MSDYEYICERFQEQAEKKAAELEAENKKLKKEKENLQARNYQLNHDYRMVKELNNELMNRENIPYSNEDAKRYRELCQKLLKDKKSLQAQVEILKAENEALRNKPRLVKK